MIPVHVKDIGFQVAFLKARFPNLKYSHRKWVGWIQPQDGFSVYKVVIVYRGPKPPGVYLLDPPLVEGAKHVYHEDDSLCLYYPKDWMWNENQIIALTIVPWTYAWLYFYEIWQDTRVWYGDEAPHPINERHRH